MVRPAALEGDAAGFSFSWVNPTVTIAIEEAAPTASNAAAETLSLVRNIALDTSCTRVETRAGTAPPAAICIAPSTVEFTRTAGTAAEAASGARSELDTAAESAKPRRVSRARRRSAPANRLRTVPIGQPSRRVLPDPR